MDLPFELHIAVRYLLARRKQASISPRHSALAPAAPPATRAMQEAVLALVRRGQREGALRADLPAELLPLAIVGTLRTTLRFAQALSLDQSKIGADVAELLIKGYAVPP